MEQNKAKGKAKITIEIEGEKTEVIETDLFTLIADLGEKACVKTFIKAGVFQVANHIFQIEEILEEIKRRAPEAVDILTRVEAKKQANEAKTKQDKAEEA